MREFPKIISVDDHVVEPPNVWQDRLPAKYRDVGPRVLRAPVKEMTFVGGKLTVVPGEPSDAGEPVDWWFYEDLRRPLMRLDAAVGHDRDDITVEGTTYEWMRPGSYQVKPRLEDMDTNWIEASLCFPTFPRFCGQTFLEAKDKDLAKLCVEAYNDWMVDEWCGESGGRLIPLVIIPLWDAQLAADEVRRNAARGVHAVCFSEIPPFLGLPSVHQPDNYWDPFFAACAETATVICMHIGSSSKMPIASPDAPPGVAGVLQFNNSMASLADWLYSGVLVRFPKLKLAYSEGQIGWIPYALERADTVWEHHDAWIKAKERIPDPPSTYYAGRIFGCFTSDEHGLRNIDAVGEDNVCFETDYPHTDTTWPNTLPFIEKFRENLTDEQLYKVLRGNAIRMLELDRV